MVLTHGFAGEASGKLVRDLYELERQEHRKRDGDLRRILTRNWKRFLVSSS